MPQAIAPIAPAMYNIDMLVHQTGFGIGSDIRSHDHLGSGLHEFHYFQDGFGQFQNGSKVYQFQPGSLFYSRPSDKHGGQIGAGSPCFQLYHVQFQDTGAYQSYLERMACLFPDGAPRQLGRSLGNAMENLRRRASNPDPMIRQSADFSLLTLLCDLASSTPMVGEGPQQGYIDTALAMMQSHLGGELSLDDIVDRLGINKSYFVRLFKESVGVSPMRYYLNLRLDTASYRLANSHAKLRQIARDLGFHDEFHFSRQFKVYRGLSPLAYRQKSS